MLMMRSLLVPPVAQPTCEEHQVYLPNITCLLGVDTSKFLGVSFELRSLLCGGLVVDEVLNLFASVLVREFTLNTRPNLTNFPSTQGVVVEVAQLGFLLCGESHTVG